MTVVCQQEVDDTQDYDVSTVSFLYQQYHCSSIIDNLK